MDGQNNHKWDITTPVLKHALEEQGTFQVAVSTAPGKGAAPEAWKEYNQMIGVGGFPARKHEF